MRAGGARALALCAAVAAAGCAAAGAGQSGPAPAPARVLPVFEGPPEYVGGATVWTGSSAARPPLQVADSILQAWGWVVARAQPTGTMATGWAYFSTAPRGSADPCSPDRVGAVRLIMDPEDGGRTLGVSAEAQFASGADHEVGMSFARAALSAFHETTQQAVQLRPDAALPKGGPRQAPITWPGFAADRVTACEFGR